MLLDPATAAQACVVAGRGPKTGATTGKRRTSQKIQDPSRTTSAPTLDGFNQAGVGGEGSQISSEQGGARVALLRASKPGAQPVVRRDEQSSDNLRLYALRDAPTGLASWGWDCRGLAQHLILFQMRRALCY